MQKRNTKIRKIYISSPPDRRSFSLVSHSIGIIQNKESSLNVPFLSFGYGTLKIHHILIREIKQSLKKVIFFLFWIGDSRLHRNVT